MDDNLKELMNTVVQNDYCIGCGTCASINNSPLAMQLNEYGTYKPYMNKNIIQSDNMEADVLSVCPFSNSSNNETEIGRKVFGEFNNVSFNEHTGFYIKNYAGYVKEGDFRKKGSSGGMGNWIAAQLLKNNLVDGIIHVKPKDGKNNILFEYQISNSLEELSKGAKSKYYPIEMSKVIQLVRESKGRYALIGLPCFIKSIRLLSEQDNIIKERIKYYIGLVCGHLKSDMFAKSMAWELGIKPDDLYRIDFRKKLEGRTANNYGVEVCGKKNGEKVVLSSPTKELYTTNWGHGLFKYKACEFCDDVLAETADVTVGDAWLPEYSKDSLGTNIITVRNPVIQNLLEKNKNNIHIEEISPRKVYQSQAGGFRHRRNGLAYRLHLKDINKQWRPKKRVEANSRMSNKRKRIYEKRMLLSQESFKAYKVAEEAEDFNVFKNHMDPIIKDYNKMVAPPIPVRAIRKLKRKLSNLFKN
ncbi:Coenzyme F420 hydrogenase/dehydrogenase, beta subunit C-terminal domain [Halalkalibacterium halodurans]|uniref:Coenzyme F420 hydrogenase n=1 Tax=Halalkalibacterium halodurans TaxID=86665 RepID=A0A0M0KGF2_ALKHA|nr:Coenzyme F420 hydrogenase/dehydrogenase, beta subunit C-terminal domain [Halalkalibacterium halodurans]TPE68973.1 coenzyme F420 hydrogenase [Halalkalibacterium halodurans]